ncbi:Cytochrome c oxidase subunit 3 [Planctomycetes bacterium Pla163]|uniref:Cytochrome c oxidase subunit 3 n=1 Tax=Rohdeia mirabilis TaxID=2528008 RepID=A0A518CXY8_9BACT|nr:Cytochrome c oxidase subunit 3 [Planctomycetes bacterium Pla163]
MSSTSTTAADAPHDAGTGHGDDHAHDVTLAHHFESHEQQFDAGKLGIWVFLVTEILFFSGLFCAYAIWRGLHPEVFIYSHHYLDTFWGAVNTVVLLVSSLTAAWAVRSAQLGDQKNLVRNLLLTIVCAFGFLGIKTIEYSAKVHHGTLPGEHFKPHPSAMVLVEDGEYIGVAGDLARKELGLVDPEMPAGLTEEQELALVEARAHAIELYSAKLVEQADPVPPSVPTFFSIYFFMTGLHGVHVVAGIIAMFWLLKRAKRGDFTPKYFGAVDYTALYWHLVDLIWIYLFPLLYLIS